MRVKLVQALQNRSTFESKLNEAISNLQAYYDIIDIKYSTCYDNLGHQCVYSALILFKEWYKTIDMLSEDDQ